MSFLLDTDICSAHLKGHPLVISRFLQHCGNLQISAISCGELLTWALRPGASPRRLQALTDLLQDITVLDCTAKTAYKFGEIRANLLGMGTTVPSIDLLIAATALEHGLTLVTHNVADFIMVPGLTVVDWLIP